jgi:hypothetical protein
MKTPPCVVTAAFLTWLATAPVASTAGESPPPAAEWLETFGGPRTAGALRGNPAEGFRFVPSDGAAPTRLEPGMTVVFPARPPGPAAGPPPFRADLGLGQRLSGRLVAVTDAHVRLADMTGEGGLTIARGGVAALVQRPGETQVFQDGFESLDTARWSIVGEPDVTAKPRTAGAHALKVPSGGASLTHWLDEPFGSGRLEVAFHDDGAVARGQHWFVDLTFRGPGGGETVRAVLGWSEETLAVESPSGPALAVQRLARAPGWHRLTIRFGPEATEISVDGNELAHGKGPGGPLVEVRLASYGSRGAPAVGGLAGTLDDLRLVRFSEPSGFREVDATQDELRLPSGDQVFGTLRTADADALRFAIDGREVTFPWSEVAGVYFRRTAPPGEPIDGLLVRLEWRAGPGKDPGDLNEVEGALVGVDAAALTVATPYAGRVAVPRERATALRVVGRGRRLVIDPTAHHLGIDFCDKAPELDPPQGEGRVLERSFVLDDVPDRPAVLALDVVQVAGEANDLPFAALVQKGELRTNVKLNGEPFDYLNRHINSENETPVRIRLPIPRDLLRPGKNVIRFEQAGTADDPNLLDDLGLLGVALEFPGEPAGASR